MRWDSYLESIIWPPDGHSQIVYCFDKGYNCSGQVHSNNLRQSTHSRALGSENFDSCKPCELLVLMEVIQHVERYWVQQRSQEQLAPWPLHLYVHQSWPTTAYARLLPISKAFVQALRVSLARAGPSWRGGSSHFDNATGVEQVSFLPSLA